jgi:hypothetical protein
MPPRIPRSWAPYFHPQAARRGSPMNYRPGYQGSGMQPISRVPIGAYTQKATGVPLTGGQNQGVISGFPGSTGTVMSPAAGTQVTGLVIPVAGTYVINWTVTLGGTVGAQDAGNFLLFHNETVPGVSTNPGSAGTFAQAPVTITAAAGDTLAIAVSGTDGTTGSVYGASILSVSQLLTLTAGPQGLGTIWYPAQVTLSTTTGALDTSTALVYLGAQGVPITLVGTVFTGNGTVALAIPSMSPGQVLMVTWANGHAGDVAAFNIVGTMDALTTGQGP